MRFLRGMFVLLLWVSLLWGAAPANQVKGQEFGETNALSTPRVWFDPVEWLRYDDPVIIHFDNGSPQDTPPLDIYVQETTPGASRWWDIRTIYSQAGQSSYKLIIGERAFTLRARAVNHQGASSDWVESKPINRYNTFVSIRYQDHRGHPLPPIEPHLSSQGYETGVYPKTWYWIDGEKQTVFAYLTAPANTSTNPQYPGYGRWETLYLGARSLELVQGSPPTATISINLPPVDNLLSAVGAADEPRWEIQGHGSLKILNAYFSMGRFHEYLPGDDTNAAICPLWEFIDTDVSNLNQPTLSFYYQTNIPHLRVGWQPLAGGEVLPFATLSPNPNYDYWQYAWIDMTAIRETPGRPCLLFQAEGVQPAYLRFDSVALGSTRSDLALRLQAQPLAPAPDERASLIFAITNHSPYTATASLQLRADTLSTPMQQLLPTLAPGGTLTATIPFTAPVSGGSLPYEAVVGNPLIDDTPADNTYRGVIIVDPLLGHLPLQILTASASPPAQR